MKLLICAIYDSKVGAYAPPFFFKTKGEAIRSFTDACRDSNSPFARHPADYRMFQLGEFDDNSGQISAFTSPDPIIGADEIG